ncbi:MAG: polymorphic toxin type 23 domain-containing protein [Crocinitomicaceae bacterium]|nr:polymorphic toxin type 23 domain-containing protein [Crocinitomicaceae bacterium]
MKIIVFIYAFFALSASAQDYFKDHFGATVGVSLNFGTHLTAIGLNLKGYYTDYFFQVNAGSTVYFYEKGLAKRNSFWESRTNFGLVLLAGKKQMDRDFQLDGLNHQTNYNFGLGYNYVMYFDNVGTSQRSGAFGFHLKNVSIYHENDVFGGQAKDRFRTGHFYVSYRKDDLKIGGGFNLWTGETSGAYWEKLKMKNTPNGFKILEDLPYGKTSHGILYASVIYNLPYGQDAHFKVGIDSENIRHAIQNRLIHDLIFLPEKLERTTPHYPRLDENGCPAFDVQDVRRLKFYMQFGMNENWSN